MIIHAEGHGNLPEVKFPFADGTVETLLWDVENWTWYWVQPDGSRKKLRGVTNTVHCMSKDEILINWVRKVCLAKVRELLMDGYVGEQASVLYEPTLDEILSKAKQENDRILKDAASVGHLAHSHVESWIRAVLSENSEKRHELYALMPLNPADPTDERPTNCVIAAFTWIADHNVRFESTEKPVFSRVHLFAGTCDGTGLVDSCNDPTCCPVPFKDHRSIIDHKTSNTTVPYLEYVFQVCAYQHALEAQTGEQYEDRWINLYSKSDGQFRAWRFAGREQYERGFLGFRRCLDLRDSMERGQGELDDMRDKRTEERRAAGMAEKLLAQKIKCKNSDAYKGVRLPMCNHGDPCKACLKKWADRHPSTL